jgi:sigma-B regulation protein RsbU (phosphoserine phosphatase)
MNAQQTTSKILIVDDKPQNLYTLEQVLKPLNVGVVQAASGDEALQLTLLHEFCLAIVDVQMPEMDGYELVELLRGNPDTACLPVIFVSAIYSDEYHHRKGYDAGAVDFLSKPFVPEILLSKVQVFLDLHYQKVQLQERNAEIQALNQRLASENLRMEAELHVGHRLQRMLLPSVIEIEQLEGVDIAGFMQPADEVGGDYYDILQHNGHVKIGIGDVTGHGLESGVVMLMVQTAIRTLLIHNEQDLARLIEVVNQTLYHNLRRMNIDKTLSLALLDYQAGTIRVSGQHEKLIVVRASGQVTFEDTFDLGFALGLEEDISPFVTELTIELQPGDGVVLYSDGITEAESMDQQFYGLERLGELVSQTWPHAATAAEVKQAIIDDVMRHIGEQKIYDDLTLIVLKQQ